MERPAFGRKRPAHSVLPPHPGPDDDGVSRIFPKSLWEGKAGDLLRFLGRDPDDASNMMPTQQLVQARHDAAFAQQTRFVDSVNAKLPEGTKVAPYAMLPWELWRGQFGQLLMVVCNYYPTQPWNTMLLPEEERSSFVLQLPIHPGAYPSGLVPAAEEHLGKLRAELDRAHEKADERLSRGDMDLKPFGAVVDHVKNSVVGLANSVASISLGHEAYDRHLKVFGEMLGWPHAKSLRQPRP